MYRIRRDMDDLNYVLDSSDDMSVLRLVKRGLHPKYFDLLQIEFFELEIILMIDSGYFELADSVAKYHTELTGKNMIFEKINFYILDKEKLLNFKFNHIEFRNCKFIDFNDLKENTINYAESE